MSLRILCYNIHGGYDFWRRRDLRRIHDLLEMENIDIAVFQEMETRPSRGGTVNDITLVAGPSRPHHLSGFALREGEGWYGNLIVSRYPMLRKLVHDLGTAPHLEPRNAVDALLDTPQGHLRIIGTHLSLVPVMRLAEAQTLTRLIDAVDETDKNSMLLMGDINEWRGGSKLLSHLNDILTPVSLTASFPAFCPILHLDRVWAHHIKGKVLAYCLKNKTTRTLSDHLPVVVEIG